MIKNWRNQVKEDEYVVVTREHESKKLGDQVEKFWNEEQISGKKASLIRALFKSFGTEFILCGLIYFPFDMASTYVYISTTVVLMFI